MLFLMILFNVLVNCNFTESRFGSALLYNKIARAECWGYDDIVRLRAKKSVESLIPQISPQAVNSKSVKVIHRYLRTALKSVDKDLDPAVYNIVQDAVADTIGAHLRSEILPAVRFAYYAGYIPYRNARQLHDLFDNIKKYLNTRGLGWTKPKRNAQKWSNLTVAKIMIGAASIFDPCACFVVKRDANSCIHLPVPRYDDAREPSVVALPFKTGGLVSMSSPKSNNALLKYYTTASKCILSKSPEKCRHSDFVNFNNELWHWMKRDVAPHLMDEKLYSAYGGIFRVAASVQNYGKGLSRRNLISFEDDSLTDWNPWHLLKDSNVYIDTDWTPTFYVIIVFLTAISVYLVQICYSYVCGDVGCRCRSASVEDFNYQSVETGFENETVWSPKREQVYSVTKQVHRSKSASVASVRTQKVFDMNENTEKVMEVIASDESLVEELSSSDESIGEKSCSPPRLQASVSQMIVNRSSTNKQPIYSTSTMSRTLTGRQSDSACLSSSDSGSQSSSSSGSRRTRSSRDLSWARRVLSRHASRKPSSSRTELDGASYTTQTSKR